MFSRYTTQCHEDYPIFDIPEPQNMTDREKEAIVKIQEAASEDEIVTIISDELVHSLIEQLGIDNNN